MLLESDVICLCNIGNSIALIFSSPVVISNGGVHNNEHVHDLEELLKPDHCKEKEHEHVQVSRIESDGSILREQSVNFDLSLGVDAIAAGDPEDDGEEAQRVEKAC